MVFQNILILSYHSAININLTRVKVVHPLFAFIHTKYHKSLFNDLVYSFNFKWY